MTSHSARLPRKGRQHDALAVFLGDWRAQGTSYGGPSQSKEHPRAGARPWTSIHSARWHSGDFFLVQDERATGPFDTLSVMGVDSNTDELFAATFENHGFNRRYRLTVDGDVWLFSGEWERAHYVFTQNATRQLISWEWKPKNDWLPLCDRVAVRID